MHKSVKVALKSRVFGRRLKHIMLKRYAFLKLGKITMYVYFGQFRKFVLFAGTFYVLNTCDIFNRSQILRNVHLYIFKTFTVRKTN